MSQTSEPEPESVQKENPQDRVLMDSIKSGDGISGFMESLAAGANVNAKLSEQGNGFKIEADSALHLVARFRGKQPEYTRLLLEHGADVHSFNSKGRTALFQACMECAEEVCTLLIKNGSRLDSKDSKSLSTFELMLTRFEAPTVGNFIHAMSQSQTQYALDCVSTLLRKLEFFEKEKKSGKPGVHKIELEEKLMQIRFYSVGPSNLPERCASALAMLQSRQARLAMELLLATAGTVKPGAAPCARRTQP